MPLRELCQCFNVLGEHTLRRRAWYGLRRNLGIRTHLRRHFGRFRIGESSQYAEGQWVQVRDRERIQSTLDAQSRLRGLLFLPFQWAYCGGVYRVQKVLRRMLDDESIFRPVSRTILLEGVFCSGPSGTDGCGRRCPLMFRDEWVKPATAPATPPSLDAGTGAFVRVRSAREIRSSLDWQGKSDGLMFMPEMYRWVGMRFRVARQLQSVFECEGAALLWGGSRTQGPLRSRLFHPLAWGLAAR